ncbi:MAG: putative bifunctional diguanylate cyclase/phosphodiesterase [Thioalkalivibrionaceae bacterium]
MPDSVHKPEDALPISEKESSCGSWKPHAADCNNAQGFDDAQKELFRERYRALNRLLSSGSFWNAERQTQLDSLVDHIGRALTFSRVGIWRYNDIDESLEIEALYCAHDEASMSALAGAKAPILAIRRCDAPLYFRTLEQEHFIEVAKARDDPRTATLKSYLDEFGIEALLDIAIFRQSRLDGVLCCETSDKSRRWSTADIALVTSMANVVSEINLLELWQSSQEQLIHRTEFDPQTGFPLRVRLDQRLLSLARDRQTQAADRTSTCHPSTNDASTHQTALVAIRFPDLARLGQARPPEFFDAVVNALAGRLRTIHRSYVAIVARIQVDEFHLLVEQLNDVDAFHRLIDNLCESLAEPIHIGTRTQQVATAIGTALSPADTPSMLELPACALLALERALTLDQTVRSASFRPEWKVEHEQALRLETGLIEALQTQAFVPYYQPIVDAENGATVGLELLARWNHPEYGILAPNAFLAAMTRSGLLDRLTESLLMQVHEHLKRFEQDHGWKGTLAINLAPSQLESRSSVELIEHWLTTTRFPGERLRIEVLEDRLACDTENLLNLLAPLTNRGVRLAIDDFGVGFSSLSRLRELPVHVLKIDRSLVNGLPEDSAAQSICRAVIGLSKGLKLECIAEGVESLAQANWLQTQGVDSLQGYVFARPMPAVDVGPWLRTVRRQSSCPL